MPVLETGVPGYAMVMCDWEALFTTHPTQSLIACQWRACCGGWFRSFQQAMARGLTWGQTVLAENAVSLLSLRHRPGLELVCVARMEQMLPSSQLH